MRRLHIWVSGTVQGVSFRESMRREAEKLRVGGWVRNLPDGRVEAVLEGEPYSVDALVQWCHLGPEQARVRHVEVVPMDAAQAGGTARHAGHVGQPREAAPGRDTLQVPAPRFEVRRDHLR